MDLYGHRRREWQLAVGLLSFDFMRIPTTRVATRIGLAQLWAYAEIVDASGNSQWACPVLDSCGDRRREWQLAVGLVGVGVLRISSTRMATRSGLAQCLEPCGYRRREWQLEAGLLSVGVIRMSSMRVATRSGLAGKKWLEEVAGTNWKWLEEGVVGTST